MTHEQAMQIAGRAIRDIFDLEIVRVAGKSVTVPRDPDEISGDCKVKDAQEAAA